MMGKLNIVGFLTGFVDQNKIIEYNQPSKRENIGVRQKKNKNKKNICIRAPLKGQNPFVHCNIIVDIKQTVQPNKRKKNVVLWFWFHLSRFWDDTCLHPITVDWLKYLFAK